MSCPLWGKASRADSPRATPATLPMELYAVCCVAYTAKSCPWFRVTASHTWPGRVTQAQGHHCGRVCLSKDLVRQMVPEKPNATRWGGVSQT